MRSYLLAPILLLASLSLTLPTLAAEVDADGVAFIDLLGPARVPYEHEPYTLRVRVAYDPAFFRQWGAPLFRRPLDLPFQVTLPWGDEVALGSASSLVPVPEAEGVRIAFGDEVVVARRVGETLRGERLFGVLEIARHYDAAPPSRVDLPAPVLRFAYASSFEEDFFGERRALDRHDVRLEGAPLAIESQPLPTVDRPPTFRDAVGRFRFRVDAAPMEGSSPGLYRVVMRIAGDGNIKTLTPPRIHDGPDLHVRGRLDDVIDGVRVVTWEVEVSPDAGGVLPPIPFSSFDPDAGAWDTSRSETIVLGPRGPMRAPPRPPPPPPPPSAQPAQPPAPPSPGLLVVGMGAVLLLFLVARGWWARRAPASPPSSSSSRPPPPSPSPLPRTSPTVPEAKGQPAAGGAAAARDREDALLGIAAAVLGRPPAAAIGVDLAVRLAARGMDPALAARLAAAIEGAVGARYGGEAVDPDAIDRLLGELGDAAPAP